MVYTATINTSAFQKRSMSPEVCKACFLLEQMIKSFLEFKKGFSAASRVFKHWNIKILHMNYFTVAISLVIFIFCKCCFSSKKSHQHIQSLTFISEVYFFPLKGFDEVRGVKNLCESPLALVDGEVQLGREWLRPPLDMSLPTLSGLGGFLFQPQRVRSLPSVHSPLSENQQSGTPPVRGSCDF